MKFELAVRTDGGIETDKTVRVIWALCQVEQFIYTRLSAACPPIIPLRRKNGTTDARRTKSRRYERESRRVDAHKWLVVVT